MNWKIGISAAIIAASVSLVSASSFATSCIVDSFNHIVVDAGDVVPVNVGGIAWASNLPSQEFQITLKDGDNIDVDYIQEAEGLKYLTLIRPADWTEGKTYHLTITPNGASLPADVETIDVTISVTAPLLAATVTDFSVADMAIETVLDSELNQRDGAWVDIKATLSPSNFYTFKTTVDGKSWISNSPCVTGDPEPGQTTFGFGVDRLTAICVGLSGEFLEPGKHEAQMVIGIMGTDETTTTAALEVDIDCGGGATVANGNSADDDGCSTTKSSGSLILLVLGALFFRRRRS